MTGDVLLANAIAVSLLMLTFWLLSLPLRNVAIVDVAWGLGFVLIAWVTFRTTSRSDGLLVGLVTIWGSRLAIHLAWRNIGAEEDRRYAAMRSNWPAFPLTSLLVVFALQGAIQLIVALPIQSGIAAEGPRTWTVLRVAGVVVWAIGFAFESIGDWQLVRFKSQPENEGHVMDRGLWRYTRHPNYFGDCLVWWGLYVVAVVDGAAWWTIVGPIGMTFLLLKVSGVSLLESDLRERKPAYAAYVRRTSPFVPWFPNDDHLHRTTEP